MILHRLAIVTGQGEHRQVPFYPFARVAGTYLIRDNTIEKTGFLKVSNICPKEILCLFTPDCGGERLPVQSAIGENLAFFRIKIMPPL